MKAKKAMKRLGRIETLLGIVIDQYKAGAPEVRNLLDAAKSSVASATEAVAASPSMKAPARAPATGKPGKADKTGKRKLSAAGRKNLSVAAKKRWADAKRGGKNSLAKPSRKSA